MDKSTPSTVKRGCSGLRSCVKLGPRRNRHRDSPGPSIDHAAGQTFAPAGPYGCALVPAPYRTARAGTAAPARLRFRSNTPATATARRQPAVLAFVIRVQKRFRFRRTQHSIPIHAVLLCRPSVQVPASKTLPSPVVPAAEKPNPPTLLASPPTDQTRRLARYRPVAVGRTYLSKSSFSIPSPAPSMHFTNARVYIYIHPAPCHHGCSKLSQQAPQSP